MIVVEVIECKDCVHWNIDTEDGEGLCVCYGFQKDNPFYGDDIWTEPNFYCKNAISRGNET